MAELALVASLLALLLGGWRQRKLSRRLDALEARLAQPPAPPEPVPEPVPAPQPSQAWGRALRPRSPVLRPAALPVLGRLTLWLTENWIYPVAGAALVLAGVFLVQYAVEADLLTPAARVLLALVLAGALLLGAEALRRRPEAGPVLPATLAGAGIVIAMAAVLAALHLYALIASGTALAALAALAFGALALGWRHGPMLPALGLAAGSLAPFLLGGEGPPPPAILGYFALLALAGQAIAGLRRWAWLGPLAVVAPVAGAVAMRLAGADPVALALALGAIAAGAMALPSGRLIPVAAGPRALSRGVPQAGVQASLAASGALAGAAVLLMPGWEGPVALVALAGLVALWAWRAPALADQMVLPVVALPAWVVVQAADYGPVVLAYAATRGPEQAPPAAPTLLVALAVLVALAALLRAEAEAPRRRLGWTLAALLMPFGTLAALEATWQPAQALGAPLWAAHALALAGAATALALRLARLDRGQGPRLGAVAAMAFALIALALTVVLGKAALTLALAVLMGAAAAMDRRFDIPGLGVFQIGAGLALGWRLIVDPGLGWHLNDAGTPEALLALAATLAAPLAALALTDPLPATRFRSLTRLVIETGLVGNAAVGTTVLVVRLLPDRIGMHGGLGVLAVALIALAWVQHRRGAQPPGQGLRRVLAWLLGLAAALVLALALTLFLPLAGGFLGSRVRGWPILNDLIPAYLLPGLVLLALGTRPWMRAAGWMLAAVWAGLAIRHLWQGPRIELWRGVAEGELYAYTAALLAAGAVLVARAIQTARPDLRRLGLVLVGVAAAKAFLVDAAGLTGLLRVGAFLGLGLSLAALAWVNGWALARERGTSGA